MTEDDDDRVRFGRIAIGSRIRELRETSGISLAVCAERAGISYSYLSDVERGRRLPTLEVLDSVASALSTTVKELLTGLYPWDVSTRPAEATPPPDGRSTRFSD